MLTYTALLAIFLRAGLTFRENTKLLAASRHEALTDALTGLGNRRRLLTELNDDMRAAEEGEPRLLLLFDLDGFKQYNDSFGHPAGDALLARLGHRLSDAMAAYGAAYRMGGDEFCVIVRDGARQDEAVAVAVASLEEGGEGFHVSSSYGMVKLGIDAAEAPAALQLADQRMYAQKDGRRASARRQARDVLLKTLHERQPLLGEHTNVVVEQAASVGRAMQLDPEDLDVLARASELHDIGKIAIPDAILDKPGPLGRRRAGVHAPPSRDRRSHPQRRPRPAAGRPRRAGEPRALRRLRLPGRAAWRQDPARARASSPCATPSPP